MDLMIKQWDKEGNRAEIRISNADKLPIASLIRIFLDQLEATTGYQFEETWISL